MHTKPLRILIIEDLEDDVLLLLKELEQGGYQIFYTRVDTPARLLHELQQHEWDIIFCDYAMPKMDGLEALKIIRAVNSDIPCIFVSGTMDKEVVSDAISTGAQGYITKGDFTQLVAIVDRELLRKGNPL